MSSGQPQPRRCGTAHRCAWWRDVTIAGMQGRTGSANLPLHGGKAPAWLFSRMVTAVARDRHLHRGRVRARRDAAAALRSVLVSGVRLRARLRLALERRDDDGLRGGEGRAQGHRAGAGLLRRRRQRGGVAQDARTRSPAHCDRLARRAGRWSTRAGPPRRSTARPFRTAISSITMCSSSRRGRLVRRPAGDERRERDGAPVSLAVGVVRASSTSRTRRSARVRARRHSISSRRKASRCAAGQRSCHARSPM